MLPSGVPSTVGFRALAAADERLETAKSMNALDRRT